MNHAFSTIQTLLEPRSVAIVGASDDETRIGGRPLSYLLRYAKSVAVYPIKPGGVRVQGVQSLASLGDLTEKVDLCIFATPAAVSVREFELHAGEAFRTALIFGGGFAEADAKGRKLQEQLAAAAKAKAVPVLGPNCLGFASMRSGIHATLASAFGSMEVQVGSTAILSQSGGFAINLLVEAVTRKVGLSRMLSTGNEVNVDMADLLEFLADDPCTAQVVSVMEGVRNGHRLGQAMARLRQAGKPLYVLKIGRSRAGARSVASHTAIAAGNDAAFDQVLERYGATRIRSVDEAIDVMQVRQRSHGARPIVVATMSGGAAGYMADACEDHGLPLKPLSPEVSERLAANLPSYGAITNPIDLTGQIVNDLDLLERCLKVLTFGDLADTRVALFLGGMADRAPEIIETLLKFRNESPNEFAVTWLGVDENIRRRARERGLCVFDDPARLLGAWGLVDSIFRREQSPAAQAASTSNPDAVVGESQALVWVREAGIKVPGSFEADAIDVLRIKAADVRFPAVMKVVEPVMAHRAKLGGVLLDLKDVDDLARGWNILRERLGATRVIVAEQVQARGEILVGLLRDANFDFVAVVGTGGVDTNKSGSHRNLIPPFEASYFQSMLAWLPDWPGWVKASASEVSLVAQLVDIIDRLKRILIDHPHLTEIEINPLLITEAGLVAVDALAIVRNELPT